MSTEIAIRNEMTGIVPKNFESMMEMSKVFSASGLMPKGIEKPESVFVAIQMGLEVGLSPMQAVQNIACINGRPSIWGDAMLALVRSSGLLEDFDEQIVDVAGESVAVCTCKRKGQKAAIKRQFSVHDAKLAGLWEKAGPWKQYPKRMLQMRARSWVLRDGFGDVLKGLRAAEEMMDQPTIEAEFQSHQIEPQMEIKVEPKNETFEGIFAESLGEKMDEFLRITADSNKTTVDALKERACKNSEAFLNAFKSWMQKQG